MERTRRRHLHPLSQKPLLYVAELRADRCFIIRNYEYIDLRITLSNGAVFEQTLGSEYWPDASKCWHGISAREVARKIDDKHATAQYNVQALTKPKGRDSLRALVMLEKLNGACLQETRRKKTCYHQDSDFGYYCGSAASNGNYMCEACLSRAIPLTRSGGKAASC